MVRRNTAVPRLMPPHPHHYAADPDTISDSGSSTTAPPRKQTDSVLQVARALSVEEVTSQMVQGSARASGEAINRHLSNHGLIPMIRTRPEGPALDLNLNALAPTDDARQPAPRVDTPVICAYCNCAFCFSRHEVHALNLGPGHVYPAPPAPITLDLFTPPAVEPLMNRKRDLNGPSPAAARLLVCSCEHHFMATMGMLQQQRPGGAPSLDWECTRSCLRILPVVVGSEGASSPDLHANPAPPPPEPCTYAGAYWNYVLPGDEEMVELRLHADPLNLSLGRR